MSSKNRPHVAIYARVSHTEGDQRAENQIAPLRQLCAARNWKVIEEYVDQAPAANLTARTAWRKLRQDARRRRFDVVLVWKLDRAFRSVLVAELELRRFDKYGVAFVSATEPIDTSSDYGRLLFTLLAALGQLERNAIAERTRAGLERARAEGKTFGRPKGRKDRRRRHRRTKAEIRAERILAGRISLEEAIA